MKRIEHFDDLTEPPIAGRYYMVRCVYGKWNGRMAYWPIWGNKHDDEALGFMLKHYHLNRYFLSEKESNISKFTVFAEGGKSNSGSLPDCVNRRKRCIAYDLLDFPLWEVRYNPDFQAMYKSYIGNQCQRRMGWVCPHKGTDLASTAPGVDGIIICPLHGLRIDAASGVVIG